MTRVSRSNSILLRMLPVLGTALLVVAASVFALPWSGHALMDSSAALRSHGSVLRPVLLLTSYAFVAIAAYRRTGDAAASAIAMLFGAALGWAGWEWQTISPGWPLFSGLLLLLTWPGERPALVALGVVTPWALVHPGAAWAALLLLASAASGPRAESRRRLILALGGLVACALLILRRIDLYAIFLPEARPWIWAEGQAQNTLADPAGLALFILLLALLGLKLLRPTPPPAAGLAALALFGFLAWHTRSNGIWLGLAATPGLALALGGDWKETILPGRFARATILGIAMVVGVGLLVAASMIGPAVIGGMPLPAATLRTLPATGLIAYRPAFEPALLRVRSRPLLALARPADTSTYSTWQRIAANCAPADDLKKLQAAAIVLDPQADEAVIATLQGEGWHTAWSGAPAVVLLQPEAPR